MIKFQSKLSIIFTALLLISLLSLSAIGQVDAETKKKITELIAQNKNLEVLPLLEQLVASEPNNAWAHRQLGFAYISKTAVDTTQEAKKESRIKARKALVKARELGYEDLQMDGLIDGLSVEGFEKGKFSFNPKADKVMDEAESFFAQGKMDKALEKYQEAFEIDSTIYYAALFSGDVYLQKGEYAEAEIWYKKAISINPYIETAYRYSATPLMKQKKYDDALPRYVEAYITSPYSKLAISGLVNWGQITKTSLSHPRIDIPEFKIGEDGKTNSSISINPGEEDGSIAWIGYTATRSVWHEKKFSEEFPNEPRYRHTIREEIEALRSVITVANELKGKKKNLNPQIETLINLDKDGLLEAFIIIARPDNGIAQEHFAYLKNNRDKLRQYVMKYVVKK